MSNDKNRRADDGSPKGFDPPNYTQTPNTLFDLMPTMSNQELRVTLAIIRKTKGWHKQEDELSLTQLQEVTGLSRQGVINGVKQALKRGTVYRKPSGRSYKYGLVVNNVDTPSDDQSTTLTNDGQPSRPTIVNSVDTQKKTKESKEKDSVANATGGEGEEPKTTTVQEQPTDDDSLFKAVLEEAWGIPYRSGMKLPKATRGHVNSICGALREMEQPPDPAELRAFYRAWKREHPDLTAIRAHNRLPLAIMKWRLSKDAKPAPREYVPTHVDVYVPPADVVNPVRQKETAA